MTNDCYRSIYDFYKTTCDICGKEIIGVENFINAGDKVVCSEECKQKAYFNDYVEHCEIGMDVDDITEIKKMTDLTEQWKKGELNRNKIYYYETPFNTTDTASGFWLCNHLDVEKDKVEILREVPSYEEYERILVENDSLKQIRDELDCTVTQLREDKIDLEEENAQLKEQINKCYLDAINRGTANAVKAVKEFGMPERIKELVEQNAQLKELLKEWVQFEIEENPNDFTVMSERMSELANKTKEVLKCQE